MNRTDLQELANKRLKETTVLMDAGCYEGAYYLAGYVVECALKACIAKNIKQHEFPDKSLLSNKLYGHKFPELLGLSGLKAELEDEIKTNGELSISWTIVLGWSSEKRYEVEILESEAKALLAAITESNGILPWLKTRW